MMDNLKVPSIMRYISFLVAYMFILGMFSCKDDEPDPFPLELGDYSGVFYKSAPNAKYLSIDIEIKFLANEFEAQIHSRDSSYLVTGFYHITGDEIDFQRAIDAIPDDNWFPAFSERYKLNFNEEKLIMTKDFGKGVYNNFRLSRE